jgi:hypothetical protein
MAVGLIAFAGNMLGLSITPFIPGTNVNQRPWTLYILLFPYYFLQETLALILGVSVSEAPQWGWNSMLLIVNYVPAIILLIVGWLLYSRRNTGW